MRVLELVAPAQDASKNTIRVGSQTPWQLSRLLCGWDSTEPSDREEAIPLTEMLLRVLAGVD